jgi:putative DNA primase/helicase
MTPNSDAQAFQRLAQLSPTEYDRVRKSEGRRLRIRIETLDAEVAKYRSELNGPAILHSAISTLPPAIPWPEPVDAQETLSQVSDRFSLYIVLPPGAADALALWSAHAHAFGAFPQTPRLNLSSPEPGCGKTTVVDVIASLVPRPLRTENLTAPVLFRLVDQYQPTLLLDEVDSYLPQAEELRGLLNAGHKRGACAYRCEGESKAVRAFKAFAPAVLAGLGTLPGTLADRSIIIPLLPAQPEEVAARFDSLRADTETVLCRKLARWTKDNFAALQACDPPLPATAFNCLADNWRPLFAIAQIAGADWPTRALASFNHLAPVRTESPPSLTSPPTGNSCNNSTHGTQLLADIRQIFTESGVSRISSRQLVDALRVLPDRPWHSEFINPHSAFNRLARLLYPFGIRAHNIRFGGPRAKGFNIADFAEAFSKLSEQATQNGAAGTASP